MKRRFAFCVLAAVLAFPAASPVRAQSKSALDSLPEKSVLVARIRSVGRLRERFDASPLAKILERPELADLKRTVEENWEAFRNEVRAESGVDPKELFDAVRGEVLFVVGDLSGLARAIGDALSTGEEPKVTPDMVPIAFVWNTGADADRRRFEAGFSKLLDYLRREESAGVEVRDFQGGRVITLKSPNPTPDEPLKEFFLAEREGWYLAGTSRSFVEETLVNIAQGRTSGGFTQDTDVKSTLQAIGPESDAFVFVNVGTVQSLLSNTLGSTLYGFMFQKAADLLLGKSLNHFAWSASLEKQGISSRGFFHNGGASDGLLGMFKGPDFAPVPPPYVESDVVSYSTSALNPERLGAAIKEVVQLVLSFSGQATDIDTFFEQQLGVRLDDLVRAVGNRIHIIGRVPGAGTTGAGAGPALPGMPSSTIVIELRDEAPIKGLLARLSQQSQGAFKGREYLGRTIYSTPSEPGIPMPSPAFCVTDRILIFSIDAADAERIIRRLGKQAPSLADSAKFKEAVRWFPARVTAFSYASSGQTIEALVKSIEEQAEAGVGGQEAEAFVGLMKAFAEVLGDETSYGVWRPQGLYFESRATFKK